MHFCTYELRNGLPLADHRPPDRGDSVEILFDRSPKRERFLTSLLMNFAVGELPSEIQNLNELWGLLTHRCEIILFGKQRLHNEFVANLGVLSVWYSRTVNKVDSAQRVHIQAHRQSSAVLLKAD